MPTEYSEGQAEFKGNKFDTVIENTILQSSEDRDFCPHNFWNTELKLESALIEQPNGTWKCKLCGKVFKTKEEAAEQ